MTKFVLEDIWYLNESDICPCGMLTMVQLNYQSYQDDVPHRLVQRCTLCKPSVYEIGSFYIDTEWYKEGEDYYANRIEFFSKDDALEVLTDYVTDPPQNVIDTVYDHIYKHKL